MINVSQSPMTVADYCNDYAEKKIMVNRNYQRSWSVWPDAARSFLIESIILGYPVPKFSLHQILDLRSRKTVKEIVDGQQRTAAMVEFFNGDLRLASGLETEEIAGRIYSELEKEHQEAFLSYSIAIDLFVGASPEEIREVFRRMNSYTVPLNPEEDRHATFQGEFKWYIYHLSRSVESILSDARILSERNFVRMQDAKLLTEITHALANGITTTSKKSLHDIYKQFDVDFPMRDEWSERLNSAFDFLGELGQIHDGPLMKHYVVYSLILAITHVQDPLPILSGVDSPKEHQFAPRDQLINSLLQLGDAVDAKDEYEGNLKPFVDACSVRTNVKDQRQARFDWLFRALTGQLPA